MQQVSAAASIDIVSRDIEHLGSTHTLFSSKILAPLSKFATQERGKRMISIVDFLYRPQEW